MGFCSWQNLFLSINNICLSKPYTAHERTPQQERQKAAREAERGREAWTLGQGMKKPVAGCYGRLTRWKGGGDVVYMALL